MFCENPKAGKPFTV